MAVNGEDSKVIPLTLTPEFAKLVESVHRQHPPGKGFENVINEPVLALDPGETTGVAEFDGDRTIRVYQKVTKEIGPSYDWLEELLECGSGDIDDPTIPFKHLRYEDYRVYAWKADDHSWSPVHTIRWIGAIQVAAHTTNTPSSCIMAQAAKGWWTDAKLDHFDLNPKGLKHGRDALRHLLYFLLFPTKA
jgi:hypothetical protein